MSQKKLGRHAYYFVGPVYPFSVRLLNTLLNSDEDVKELINKVASETKFICTYAIDGIVVDDCNWLGAIWFQTDKGIVLVAFPHCNDEQRQDGTATERSIAFYACIWEEGSKKMTHYQAEIDIILRDILRIIGQ